MLKRLVVVVLLVLALPSSVYLVQHRYQISSLAGGPNICTWETCGDDQEKWAAGAAAAEGKAQENPAVAEQVQEIINTASSDQKQVQHIEAVLNTNLNESEKQALGGILTDTQKQSLGNTLAPTTVSSTPTAIENVCFLPGMNCVGDDWTYGVELAKKPGQALKDNKNPSLIAKLKEQIKDPEFAKNNTAVVNALVEQDESLKQTVGTQTSAPISDAAKKLLEEKNKECSQTTGLCPMIDPDTLAVVGWVPSDKAVFGNYQQAIIARSNLSIGDTTTQVKIGNNTYTLANPDFKFDITAEEAIKIKELADKQKIGSDTNNRAVLDPAKYDLGKIQKQLEDFEAQRIEAEKAIADQILQTGNKDNYQYLSPEMKKQVDELLKKNADIKRAADAALRGDNSAKDKLPEDQQAKVEEIVKDAKEQETYLKNKVEALAKEADPEIRAQILSGLNESQKKYVEEAAAQIALVNKQNEEIRQKNIDIVAQQIAQVDRDSTLSDDQKSAEFEKVSNQLESDSEAIKLATSKAVQQITKEQETIKMQEQKIANIKIDLDLAKQATTGNKTFDDAVKIITGIANGEIKTDTLAKLIYGQITQANNRPGDPLADLLSLRPGAQVAKLTLSDPTLPQNQKLIAKSLDSPALQLKLKENYYTDLVNNYYSASDKSSCVWGVSSSCEQIKEKIDKYKADLPPEQIRNIYKQALIKNITNLDNNSIAVKEALVKTLSESRIGDLESDVDKTLVETTNLGIKDWQDYQQLNDNWTYLAYSYGSGQQFSNNIQQAIESGQVKPADMEKHIEAVAWSDPITSLATAYNIFTQGGAQRNLVSQSVGYEQKRQEYIQKYNVDPGYDPTKLEYWKANTEAWAGGLVNTIPVVTNGVIGLFNQETADKVIPITEYQRNSADYVRAGVAFAAPAASVIAPIAALPFAPLGVVGLLTTGQTAFGSYASLGSLGNTAELCTFRPDMDRVGCGLAFGNTVYMVGNTISGLARGTISIAEAQVAKDVALVNQNTTYQQALKIVKGGAGVKAAAFNAGSPVERIAYSLSSGAGAATFIPKALLSCTGAATQQQGASWADCIVSGTMGAASVFRSLNLFLPFTRNEAIGVWTGRIAEAGDQLDGFASCADLSFNSGNKNVPNRFNPFECALGIYDAYGDNLAGHWNKGEALFGQQDRTVTNGSFAKLQAAINAKNEALIKQYTAEAISNLGHLQANNIQVNPDLSNADAAIDRLKQEYQKQFLLNISKDIKSPEIAKLRTLLNTTTDFPTVALDLTTAILTNNPKIFTADQLKQLENELKSQINNLTAQADVISDQIEALETAEVVAQPEINRLQALKNTLEEKTFELFNKIADIGIARSQVAQAPPPAPVAPGARSQELASSPRFVVKGIGLYELGSDNLYHAMGPSTEGSRKVETQLNRDRIARNNQPLAQLPIIQQPTSIPQTSLVNTAINFAKALAIGGINPYQMYQNWRATQTQSVPVTTVTGNRTLPLQETGVVNEIKTYLTTGQNSWTTAGNDLLKQLENSRAVEIIANVTLVPTKFLGEKLSDGVNAITQAFARPGLEKIEQGLIINSTSQYINGIGNVQLVGNNKVKVVIKGVVYFVENEGFVRNESGEVVQINVNTTNRQTSIEIKNGTPDYKVRKIFNASLEDIVNKTSTLGVETEFDRLLDIEDSPFSRSVKNNFLIILISEKLLQQGKAKTIEEAIKTVESLAEINFDSSESSQTEMIVKINSLLKLEGDGEFVSSRSVEQNAESNPKLAIEILGLRGTLYPWNLGKILDSPMTKSAVRIYQLKLGNKDAILSEIEKDLETVIPETIVSNPKYNALLSYFKEGRFLHYFDALTNIERALVKDGKYTKAPAQIITTESNYQINNNPVTIPDEVVEKHKKAIEKITQELLIPESGNFTHLSQIIASLESFSFDASSEEDKIRKQLINLIYSSNEYSFGSSSIWPIISTFLSDGGHPDQIGQTLYQLVSTNRARYEYQKKFWEPIISEFNDKYSKQLDGGVSKIDPDQIFWAINDSDYKDKMCVGGFCAVSSPLGRNNNIFFTTGTSNSEEYDQDQKKYVIVDGNIPSRNRNRAMHALLHEAIHARIINIKGIESHFPLIPDDELVIPVLEGLTEQYTISIENKVKNDNPNFYEGPLYRTYGVYVETIKTISSSLGIDNKLAEYADKQDPIGFLKLLDETYKQLDDKGKRQFIENLYQKMKIGGLQKAYLFANLPKSILDIYSLSLLWTSNFSNIGGLVLGTVEDVKRLGDTIGLDLDNNLDSIDKIISAMEEKENIKNDPKYLPKTRYSETEPGKSLLKEMFPQSSTQPTVTVTGDSNRTLALQNAGRAVGSFVRNVAINSAAIAGPILNNIYTDFASEGKEAFNQINNDVIQPINRYLGSDNFVNSIARGINLVANPLTATVNFVVENINSVITFAPGILRNETQPAPLPADATRQALQAGVTPPQTQAQETGTVTGQKLAARILGQWNIDLNTVPSEIGNIITDNIFDPGFAGQLAPQEGKTPEDGAPLPVVRSSQLSALISAGAQVIATIDLPDVRAQNDISYLNGNYYFREKIKSALELLPGSIAVRIDGDKFVFVNFTQIANTLTEPEFHILPNDPVRTFSTQNIDIGNFFVHHPEFTNSLDPNLQKFLTVAFEDKVLNNPKAFKDYKHMLVHLQATGQTEFTAIKIDTPVYTKTKNDIENEAAGDETIRQLAALIPKSTIFRDGAVIYFVVPKGTPLSPIQNSTYTVTYPNGEVFTYPLILFTSSSEFTLTAESFNQARSVTSDAIQSQIDAYVKSLSPDDPWLRNIYYNPHTSRGLANLRAAGKTEAEIEALKSHYRSAGINPENGKVAWVWSGEARSPDLRSRIYDVGRKVGLGILGFTVAGATGLAIGSIYLNSLVATPTFTPPAPTVAITQTAPKLTVTPPSAINDKQISYDVGSLIEGSPYKIQSFEESGSLNLLDPKTNALKTLNKGETVETIFGALEYTGPIFTNNKIVASFLPKTPPTQNQTAPKTIDASLNTAPAFANTSKVIQAKNGTELIAQLRPSLEKDGINTNFELAKYTLGQIAAKYDQNLSRGLNQPIQCMSWVMLLASKPDSPFFYVGGQNVVNANQLVPDKMRNNRNLLQVDIGGATANRTKEYYRGDLVVLYEGDRGTQNHILAIVDTKIENGVTYYLVSDANRSFDAQGNLVEDGQIHTRWMNKDEFTKYTLNAQDPIVIRKYQTQPTTLGKLPAFLPLSLPGLGGNIVGSILGPVEPAVIHYLATLDWNTVTFYWNYFAGWMKNLPMPFGFTTSSPKIGDSLPNPQSTVLNQEANSIQQIVESQQNFVPNMVNDFIKNAKIAGIAEENEGLINFSRSKLNIVTAFIDIGYIYTVGMTQPDLVQKGIFKIFLDNLQNGTTIYPTQVQILFNRLLDPTTTAFPDENGRLVSFVDYIKKLYGKIAIIEIKQEALEDDLDELDGILNEIAHLNQIPNWYEFKSLPLAEKRQRIQDLYPELDILRGNTYLIPHIYIHAGKRTVKAPIVTLPMTSSMGSAVTATHRSGNKTYRLIIVDVNKTKQSVTNPLGSIIHEIDHAVREAVRVDDPVIEAFDLIEADQKFYFEYMRSNRGNYDLDTLKQIRDDYNNYTRDTYKHSNEIGDQVRLINEMGGDINNIRMLNNLATLYETKGDRVSAARAKMQAQLLYFDRIYQSGIGERMSTGTLYTKALLMSSYLQERLGIDGLLRIIHTLSSSDQAVLLSSGFKVIEDQIKRAFHIINLMYDQVLFSYNPSIKKDSLNTALSVLPIKTDERERFLPTERGPLVKYLTSQLPPWLRKAVGLGIYAIPEVELIDNISKAQELLPSPPTDLFAVNEWYSNTNDTSKIVQLVFEKLLSRPDLWFQGIARSHDMLLLLSEKNQVLEDFVRNNPKYDETIPNYYEKLYEHINFAFIAYGNAFRGETKFIEDAKRLILDLSLNKIKNRISSPLSMPFGASVKTPPVNNDQQIKIDLEETRKNILDQLNNSITGPLDDSLKRIKEVNSIPDTKPLSLDNILITGNQILAKHLIETDSLSKELGDKVITNTPFSPLQHQNFINQVWNPQNQSFFIDGQKVSLETYLNTVYDGVANFKIVQRVLTQQEKIDARFAEITGENGFEEAMRQFQQTDFVEKAISDPNKEGVVTILEIETKDGRKTPIPILTINDAKSAAFTAQAKNRIVQKDSPSFIFIKNNQNPNDVLNTIPIMVHETGHGLGNVLDNSDKTYDKFFQEELDKRIGTTTDTANILLEARAAAVGRDQSTNSDQKAVERVITELKGESLGQIFMNDWINGLKKTDPKLSVYIETIRNINRVILILQRKFINNWTNHPMAAIAGEAIIDQIGAKEFLRFIHTNSYSTISSVFGVYDLYPMFADLSLYFAEEYDKKYGNLMFGNLQDLPTELP